MPMQMWLCQIRLSVVLVLMVLIVCMSMRVFKWCVGVFVLVSLGHVKPNT